MTWNYAYTPQIWPTFLTVLLLIALEAYGWHKRSAPGVLLFTTGCLFATLWSASSLMRAAALDATTKIFWVKFQAVWQLPTATAITCFLLEYTWPGRWLTRRNLALLSIAPLLFLGLILTNDLHHLAWTGFELNGAVLPLRASGTWFFIIYAVSLLGTIHLLVFGWLFLRSPQHRWPVVVLFIGLTGAIALYLLEKAYIVQYYLPLDVIALGFMFLTYTIALFGFHILDPIPLARQTVIAQMLEGMLVLDHQGRVVSLNPAAEKIFGNTTKRVKGKPARDLLPAYPSDSGVNEIEFSLGAGLAIRHYTLTISLLHDFRGLEVGRLGLLHDVTAQKRAQAKILAQQRSLATLQERERLARELHDSLGQTLAAAHLQAGAAKLLLAQGEMPEAEECLEQVLEMTVTAETDMREYLLGTKIFFPASLPFFVALRQFVQRFSKLYRLPVELNVPAQLEAMGLGPAIEVQALRIIQEVLSNVRKHAHAHNVQIDFSLSGERVQIAIADDGQGFDPAAAGQVEGFGLISMRERAEALGGSFSVTSQPGQGTRVVVEAPLWSDAEVRAHGFVKKGGRGERKTRGRGEAETRGEGDMETRGKGDAENERGGEGEEKWEII